MANKRISQGTLAAILRRRKRIADLSTELENLETALTEELRAGAKVAPGILTAFIKEWTRRNVAWREKFQFEISKRDGEGKGEELAERILAATRPETYSKVCVESI